MVIYFSLNAPILAKYQTFRLLFVLRLWYHSLRLKVLLFAGAKAALERCKVQRGSQMKKLMLAACAAVSLSGFAAEYWASTTGGDAAAGTKAEPTSLAAALAAAKASGEASTVHLADGEYKTAATILLDTAITLVGETRDGVKINSQQKCSAITITSPDAVVTNLTVMNGKSSESGLNRKGGGIFMSGGGTVVGCRITGCVGARQAKGLAIYNVGGTVRNCVIDGNAQSTDILWGAYCQEGANALMDSCVVTNNSCGGPHQADGCVAGVYLIGGVCTNSLIAKNEATGVTVDFAKANRVAVGALVLSGATLADCTLVDNTYPCHDADLYRPGAVSVASGGIVRNCLIYGTKDENGFPVNIGSSGDNTSKNTISNCCVSVGETAGRADSNSQIELPFHAWRDGVFTLLPGSPCYEKGIGRPCDRQGGYPATDPAACTMSYDRSAVTGVAPFDVRLTGYAGGAIGSTWKFVWTFENSAGDSVTTETTEQDVTVTLPVGSYALRLDVVDDGGNVLCTCAAPDTFRVWRTDAPDVYVKPPTTETKAAAKYPFDSWETAATDLQTAAAGHLAGTTFHLAEGTHPLTKTLTLNRPVTLLGTDREKTVIEGNATFRLVRVRRPERGDAIPALTVGNMRFSKGKSTSGNSSDTEFHGGGLDLPAGGSVSNCVFDACRVRRQNRGGGLYLNGGTVVDSVFRNCVMDDDITPGVAASLNGTAVMDRCVITNCTATSNGHQNYRNAALQLEGSCEVRNSVIANNTTKYSGSGTSGWLSAGVTVESASAKLVNCTITGNRITSDYGAAGVSLYKAGTVENCIIVDNTRGSDRVAADIYGGSTGTWTKNCIVNAQAVAPKGDNFNPTDPHFKANTFFELPIGSGCLAVGVVEPWMETALDVSLAPRLRTDKGETVVDVGAVAYRAADFVCEAQSDSDRIQVGSLTAIVRAVVEGDKEGVRYYWIADGSEDWVEGTDTLTLSKTQSGTYGVRLRVTNDAGADIEADPLSFTLLPARVYLNPASKTAQYPYETPSTAASNLADVVAISAQGDGVTLNIAPGTYTLKSGQTFMRRVSIIGAGEAPTDTVFKSSGYFRCFALMASGSVMSNVTVRGGYACNDSSTTDGPGGNVYAKAGVTLTHCVFSGGRGVRPSAGANVALNGATMRDCEIYGSSITGSDSESGAAIIYGLGVFLYGDSPLMDRCVVHDCKMFKAHPRDRHSQGTGVHVVSGTVRNTLVYDCVQTTSKGDTDYLTHAAGVYLADGLLENSTVVDCCAESAAGGVYANGGRVENCIVWGCTNLTGAVANWGGADASYAYTCTTPKILDEHSIDADPCFNLGYRSRRPSYSLRSGSPCVDAGTNRTWAAEATDLFGQPRVQNRAIDMGCYECRRVGMMLMVR